MNKENKTFIQNLCISVAAIALVVSCESLNKSMTGNKVEKDCSSIFEDKNAKVSDASQLDEKGNKADVQTTECKILKVKISDDAKCQVVGSDKIDNLNRVIETNARKRLILIGPEDKFVEYFKLANKYLKYKQDIDIKKYLDSDILKDFPFEYKGLKCVFDDQELIVWSGKGKVISTFGKSL